MLESYSKMLVPLLSGNPLANDDPGTSSSRTDTSNIMNPKIPCTNYPFARLKGDTLRMVQILHMNTAFCYIGLLVGLTMY